MASLTLKNEQRFPVGTSVGLYPRANWLTWQLPPSGPPLGSATATATVAANGTLSFGGLPDSAEYYVHASVGGAHRYARVSTVPDTSSPVGVNTIDAKGDLLVGSADNAVTRLAAGADGTVLVSDPSQASGVRWGSTGGSDAVPASHKMKAWTFDPVTAGGGTAPSAGVLRAFKFRVPTSITVVGLGVVINTAGSGTTALANCFLALYSKAGVLLGRSADQSAAWGSTGYKHAPLTAEAGQSLALTGGPNEFAFAAMVIGTQSTTNVSLFRGGGGNEHVVNAGLAPADGLRNLATGSALTAPPATFDPLAGANGHAYWVGVT